MQAQMLKQRAREHKSSTRSGKSELEAITGKLIGISKALHDRQDNYCMYDKNNETSRCKYKQTTITHYIAAPFPKTFCININWYDNNAPYMDTLRFCASIPQKFELSDLFEVKSHEKCQSSYILQSVVCFLGAHYMTYIKKKDMSSDDSLPVWKLYDDQNPIQIYMSWKEILEKILEYGTLPTVLVYE